MITLITQREKTVWVLFLTTSFLSGFFACINLSEFVTIGVLKQTGSYPFGGESPAPWYYQTPQLYATVNLIFGLLFFLVLAFGCRSFRKVKKSALIISFVVTLFLICVQLLNGQPT